MPRAKFDMDFENGRYWGGGVYIGDSTLSPGSRGPASLVTPDNGGIVQFVEYPDGILRTFPAFSNRIVPGRGLLAEDQCFNNVLWNRDFTNAAWVKSNMTAAKNQAGADLTANAASSLTATANNGTCLQTVTSSTNKISSCYVKRLTGSGSVYMTMDGSTYTDITSQINSTSYVRVSIPPQTLTTFIYGFKLATSGDAIAVDLFQCESTARVSVPSSPVATTSASVTRANEHISFYSNGAHPNAGQRIIADIFYCGGPFSTFCKYSGNPVGGGGLTIGTDGTSVPMGVQNGGANASAALYAGCTTGNSGNTGIGNWNKLAGRTTGFGSDCCLNGGAITSKSSSKPPAATLSQAVWTHGSFGNNGSGTTGNPMNGYIARVAL